MKPSPPIGNTMRILLVDHEGARRDAMEQRLNAEGFQTGTASNRHEALESLRRSPADLVIMNMYLPGAEGIGTILAIQSFAPEMRIIAMSGGGAGQGHDFLPLAKSLGAAALLSDPLDAAQLTAALQQAFALEMHQVAC